MLPTGQLVDGFIPNGFGGVFNKGTAEDSEYSQGQGYRGGLVDNFRMIPPGESQRNWIRLRRPYFDKFDRPCVNINYGRWTTEKGERKPVLEKRYIGELIKNNWQLPPVVNATSLRKEEWDLLDSVVLRAARFRLRLWADVASRNSYGGFNGMSKLILEHETQSDPGEAIVDMDALTEGRTDTPNFQLQGLPLPITHSDFWTSSRFLGVSRNSGTPFDVNMGEAAARRVAESIEKVSIGTSTGAVFGGLSTQQGGYGRTSQVYGLINFPARNIYNTLHNPSLGGWSPSQTLADVLAMRQQLYNVKFTGPYIIYHTNDWDNYLDNDYILTGGNVATQTLRNRLRSIEGIEDVRRLDFWFGSTPTFPLNTSGLTPPGLGVDVSLQPFSLLMVQMTPDVIRAVNGMDITTVQWESVGGMRLNFKCLCIQVPQIRADFYNDCGISHGTIS